MSGASELRDAISRLETLLADEHALLSAGRLADVAALTAPKMEAMRTLEGSIRSGDFRALSAEDRPRVANIQRRAAENGTLFVAVRNGLQQAINRLTKNDSGGYVGAYGQDGSQKAFNSATGGYLKRI